MNAQGGGQILRPDYGELGLAYTTIELRLALGQAGAGCGYLAVFGRRSFDGGGAKTLQLCADRLQGLLAGSPQSLGADDNSGQVLRRRCHLRRWKIAFLQQKGLGCLEGLFPLGDFLRRFCQRRRLRRSLRVGGPGEDGEEEGSKAEKRDERAACPHSGALNCEMDTDCDRVATSALKSRVYTPHSGQGDTRWP